MNTQGSRQTCDDKPQNMGSETAAINCFSQYYCSKTDLTPCMRFVLVIVYCQGQDHPTHPDTMVLVKENSELRKLLIDVLQQKQQQQSSAPSTPAPAPAEPAPQPPSRPQYQSPDRDSSRRAINRRQPVSYQSNDESRPRNNGGGAGRGRDGDDDMQIVSSGWKARAEAAEAAVRELQNQLRDVRNGRSQDAATGAAEREAAVVDATAALRRSLQSLSHDSAETIRELRDQISSLQQQLSEARQEVSTRARRVG